MNHLLKKRQNKLLDLLISKSSSPSQTLLYLLLRDKEVTIKQAQKNGVKNVPETLFYLRKQGWKIINSGIRCFKINIKGEL